MSCLKINNEEGQTVGVIPIYSGESTLTKLREEITDDFEINNFLFAYCGKKLDKSEEHSTNVASVAQEMVEHVTGAKFFSLTILNHSELDVDDDCNDDQLKITIKTTTTTASDAISITPCSSTSKVSESCLRSPTSWEMRGVKIYTQREIEKAKGMEKKRREFWNKEAKRLCRETKKSKNDIMKELNIAWRKHRSTLLLKEENFIQKMQNDAIKEGHYCQNKIKCKPGTIQKNFDRIRQHKNELDQVTNEIENTKRDSVVGKKRKLDQLDDKKSYHLVEMKKAQDAL